MTETSTDTKPDLDALLDAEPDESSAPEELAVPADSLAAQLIDENLGTHRGYPVLPFDFRRPYNISKAFEKNMMTICETFAKVSSLSFTSMLRANVAVEQERLQLTTFGEFLKSLPELSCVATMSQAPLSGQSLFLMDIGMSFTVMKRLLGGPIEPENDHRKFTDIEFAVTRIIMNKFLDAFGQGLEKIVPVEGEIHTLENSPTYLGTMSSTEAVILLRFTMTVDTTEGELIICMPLTAFEPVWDRFSPEEGVEYRNAADVRRDRLQMLDNLQVAGADVVVNLGELCMPMAQVLQIKEGDLIPLNKPVGDKLKVEVQGKTMFLGSPGKVNNRRALKITDRLLRED
ncbi:FliM/FliN family flagellar motor switch protein [bacterium]|nr:FliM/FliN family flagellar motor switch protein [bacterium]